MTLLDRLNSQTEIKAGDSEANNDQWRENQERLKQIQLRIHQEVIDVLEKEADFFTGSMGEEELRERVKKLLEVILERDWDNLDKKEQKKVFDAVFAEVVGYGPIEPLILDDAITEIMVNGLDQVYFEKKGKIYRSDIVFRDNRHVMHLIEKIVAPLGRRIDESMPMVDARLPDGSRVNAIIPPLSLVGPVITIRKFSKDPYQMKDLIAFNTLVPDMSRFLEACVKARINMIVSGGTGSGKTTTLNVISSFIPNNERIITIEDAAELQMHQEHVVTLESRPPNIEGKGAITIRDLVRNSLRMRPDRIIVGEVRSGEALDMLQAMNTGHDGSITTGHANSPRDILARIETMVLMAGVDLPIRAIREQIASGINLIVHETRLRDGSRKITNITEVIGMEGEKIVLQDIFQYVQEGVDNDGKIVGQFKSTGIIPQCVKKIKENGVHVPIEIFSL